MTTITKTEYSFLKEVLALDGKKKTVLTEAHGQLTVEKCISMRLVKMVQDRDNYCDDHVRLTITSKGILELNIYRKAMSHDPNKAAEIR